MSKVSKLFILTIEDTLSLTRFVSPMVRLGFVYSGTIIKSLPLVVIIY